MAKKNKKKRGLHRSPIVPVLLLGAGVTALAVTCNSLNPSADLPPDQALERLQGLMEGPTSVVDEGEIIRIFTDVSPETFDHLLSSIDLEALLEDVDDHTPAPANQCFLLDELTKRIKDTSLRNRGRLIDALQYGPTDADHERYIRDIFVAHQGLELTDLKRHIERGDDDQDLHKLLYSDIDDDAVRARILDHFADHMEPTGEVKVLSDIDDTLYCSINDARYPSDTLYPGILALYRELDRGPHPDAQPEGDLAFLTARPGDRTGFVENWTQGVLAQHGLRNAVVLAGDFLSLTSHQAMAERKLQNFTEYCALYPEFHFVFLGDSGQGDAILGRSLQEQYADRVELVVIHDVANTSDADRAAAAARGVVYCDTDLGAALAALDAELIGTPGLARVAAAFVDDLAAVEFDSSSQRDALYTLARRDLDAVNARLPEADRVSLD